MMDQSNENCVPCDPSSNRRHYESGSNGGKWVTGQMTGGDQTASAKWATGITNSLQLRKKKSIATWNVRGLLQVGKLYILEQELLKQKVDICGISETHWIDSGHFNASSYRVFSSGRGNISHSGVAILVHHELAQYVLEYLPVNNRLIKITIGAKPTNLHIIQVYMPTSQSPEEDVETVYDQIEAIISNIPSKDHVIILGDWNAKIGRRENEEHLKGIVGIHGLGTQNPRGDRLVEFATANSFAVANTMFKHHARRLSTWTSPDGQTKNQIDYILIRRRWRTAITDVKAKGSADCGTDHKLLRADHAVKFKKPAKGLVISKKCPQDNEEYRAALGSTEIPQPGGDPQHTWNDTRRWIINAIDRTNPKNEKAKQNHWMSGETLQLVEQRRAVKAESGNPQEKQPRINHISKQIKNLSRRDKNNHIKQICTQLQQHANRNESRELYNTVKYLSRDFKLQTQVIKNAGGKIITNPEEIADVWKCYCEDLYAGTNDEFTIPKSICEKEPNILKSEVVRAIKKLKNGKAPGIDGITAEALKEMNNTGIEIIHAICCEIWNSGKWPTDWCKSIFVPIFKKGSPAECKNYRTVALIPHASKVMLTIINERLKPYLLPQISKTQSGFMPGKGTREQILNIRQIIEKSREFNLESYLCFVDYCKAFDTVQWNDLREILLKMAVPGHLVWLICNLYKNNRAIIKVNNTYSKEFSLKAGVRQGCIISPILFNIYSEYIMRETFDEWQGGIMIGGCKINNLRYADDTVVLAASKEELTHIMGRLKDVSERYGLKLNRDKTKVMIVDRANNNQLNTRNVAEFETVSHFNYLGSLITNTGGCEEEIRRRIAMGRAATARLVKIWKDRSVTKNTKLLLVKSLIFPIATYASETWTLRKADAQRMSAFEMWVYRRILRIPWTAHRTNVSILEELQITTRLTTTINRNIVRYFGHITRSSDTIERLIVQGNVEGKRSRGRSPTRWSDQIKKATGCTFSEATHEAQDKAAWQGRVAHVS